MEEIEIERSKLLSEKPMEGIEIEHFNFYPRNQWME